MPEDASLDQFASSEPTDSEDTGDGPEDAGDDSEDADTDTSPVEPAVSTYEWSSDGRECADCGASAERLWRGAGQRDGGLVCADCKEW